MDREAWCATVHGIAKSQKWLSYWTEHANIFLFLLCGLTDKGDTACFLGGGSCYFFSLMLFLVLNHVCCEKARGDLDNLYSWYQGKCFLMLWVGALRPVFGYWERNRERAPWSLCFKALQRIGHLVKNPGTPKSCLRPTTLPSNDFPYPLYQLGPSRGRCILKLIWGDFNKGMTNKNVGRV